LTTCTLAGNSSGVYYGSGQFVNCAFTGNTYNLYEVATARLINCTFPNGVLHAL